MENKDKKKNKNEEPILGNNEYYSDKIILWKQCNP